MADEPETTPVPETPVPETPAPAEPAPAEPAPEAAAPAEPAACACGCGCADGKSGPCDCDAQKAAPSGFFDKVALAPFYLLALVVGWGVASLFSGNGFACPSWLRCLALWIFFLGAVWSVVFRARVARPAGYAVGCAALFVLVALFLPHGSLEERVASKALDAMVAENRAAGYDLSVASLSTEERDDGSYFGVALLRSGRQAFQIDFTVAKVQTPDSYTIKIVGLKAEENPRLAAIRELADRLPPPEAEEPPPSDDGKTAEPAK